MKTLELNQMELIDGGDCLGATVQGGINGAISGGISGALFGGVGAGPGVVVGWLFGSTLGFIGCAIQ